MTLLEAIVLGIIQGLTEFLPISSTAHLRVIPALLGWDDPGAAFTAVIQWGTVVAVMIYFRRDIALIVRATLGELCTGRFGRTTEGRLGWLIVLGTVPVVICGLLFKKEIETTLRSLYVISASAILLALVLMVAEQFVRRRQRAGLPQKELVGLTWRDALLVGMAQAVALIPGASRSGVTITAALFLGMSRSTAARFSFLLSLPAVFGAGVLELYSKGHELAGSRENAVNLVACTVVSGVVGYASIAWLLTYLKTHSTYLFIVYRIILGIVLLALLAGGVLKDEEPKERSGKAGGAARSTDLSTAAPAGGRAGRSRPPEGGPASPGGCRCQPGRRVGRAVPPARSGGQTGRAAGGRRPGRPLCGAAPAGWGWPHTHGTPAPGSAGTA
jgi:undecaprenyl-diphosphatase